MMERASDVIMPRIIEVIEHAVGSGTRVEIETWEQLVHYLTYDVGESLDPIERDVLLRIALMNSGKIVTHKNYESRCSWGSTSTGVCLTDGALTWDCALHGTPPTCLQAVLTRQTSASVSAYSMSACP